MAVLRGGRIVQHGTPAEIYQQPADRDVAAFFGSLVALPADIHDDIAATALGPLPIRDANGTQGPATVLLRPEQIVLAPVTGDARSAVVVRVASTGPTAWWSCWSTREAWW